MTTKTAKHAAQTAQKDVDLMLKIAQQAIEPPPETLPEWKWHSLHHAHRLDHMSAAEVADFVGRTKDVLLGVREVVSMLHTSGQNAGEDDGHGNRLPMLSARRAAALERLVMASADMLNEEGDRLMDRVTREMSYTEQSQTPA